MEQKILAFMRENDIAVFAEADRTTGTVHIEKLGNLESWDLFQQLVLYSDTDTLVTAPVARSPSRSWGRGILGACSPGWTAAGLLPCFSTANWKGQRLRSGSESWIKRHASFTG